MTQEAQEPRVCHRKGLNFSSFRNCFCGLERLPLILVTAASVALVISCVAVSGGPAPCGACPRISQKLVNSRSLKSAGVSNQISYFEERVRMGGKLLSPPHLCLLTHRLDLEALHVCLLWLGLVSCHSPHPPQRKSCRQGEPGKRDAPSSRRQGGGGCEGGEGAGQILIRNVKEIMYSHLCCMPCMAAVGWDTGADYGVMGGVSMLCAALLAGGSDCSAASSRSDMQVTLECVSA